MIFVHNRFPPLLVDTVSSTNVQSLTHMKKFYFKLLRNQYKKKTLQREKGQHAFAKLSYFNKTKTHTTGFRIDLKEHSWTKQKQA